MYDNNKIKNLRNLLYAVIATVFLILGLAIGLSLGNGSSNSANTNVTAAETEVKLSQKELKEFLIAHYTKKDLGENRDRYKEYMTESLFNQTVKLEEEPVSQAYKGYVLNQAFSKGTIYIDEENLEAIAEVTYTNVQTGKRNNAEAGTNFTEKATVKLFYVKKDNKLLVDRVEPLNLNQKVTDKVNIPAEKETTTQETQKTAATTQTSDTTTQQTEKEPTTTGTQTIKGGLW